MSEDRRLAAIMFTDIVGYTKLMGSDEDKAFDILKRNHTIHTNLIKKHNGTLIKEVGDGTLASFSLGSDAVRCAMDIQKEAKSQSIPLKIGIHEGEMVMAGEDVLGDGVNVASRLQEISADGSITISGRVYSDVKNKAGIKTKFIGNKRLKNVDDSIKVYEVLCEEEIVDPENKQQPRKSNKWLYFIITGLIILVATILIWYNLPKQPDIEVEKSIAVLPFSDMSPNQDQGYFSDGMMDEILMHLYKIGDLDVVSRTSAMRYKESNKLVSEIASELGVAHILEGSVRKDEHRVRITVQLIDAINDKHLWAESYDEELINVFEIQSDVAQKIAKELRAALTPEENDLIQQKPMTRNTLAYDFYLKGNEYWARLNAPLALEMYTRAIDEDPMFASAYGRRASMHAHFCWLKLEGWPGHDSMAWQDIQEGFQLDPESIDTRYAEAVYYYMIERDYNRSISILNGLKKIAPNMAELYAYVGYNLRRQGKFDESISELKQGISLDPFNANFISNLSLTYRLLHQYNNAIENSRQGLSLVPDFEGFQFNIFIDFLHKTGKLNIALAKSGFKEEDIKYQEYYYSRQFEKLIEFLNTSEEHRLITDQGRYHPKSYTLALLHFLNGNTSQSKIYADSSIAFLKVKLREMPNDERLYVTIGKCYALTGNVEEAIKNGRRSVNLLPISLDAHGGPGREQNLLEIFILTEKYDLAMDKIEYLLSIPSWMSKGILSVDPIYDNLRSLPRFQEIISTVQN